MIETSPAHDFYIFFSPCSKYSPIILGDEIDVDVLFKIEYLWSYILSFLTSYESSLTAPPCEKKIPWPRFRVTQIFENKHNV